MNSEVAEDTFSVDKDIQIKDGKLYYIYIIFLKVVLKVLADILCAVNSGNLALLTLLDLSAAFDTVDHVTLLRRLEVFYGINGTVHNWYTSYLSVQVAVRLKRIYKVDAYCRAVWSSTGVGHWSNHFLDVHGRPAWTSGDTRVTTTSLC